jgi:hypothetical protein
MIESKELKVIMRAAIAFREFEAVARSLAMTFAKFGQVMYEDARDAYLAEYGKLPGSERTRRLRKKRRAMVMQWWGGRRP